jgi:hypothetical protein
MDEDSCCGETCLLLPWKPVSAAKIPVRHADPAIFEQDDDCGARQRVRRSVALQKPEIAR